MENIIEERHERLRSLIRQDAMREENLLLEIGLDNSILHSLQSSVKFYILDCLAESYTDRSFDANLSLDDLTKCYSSEIMSLPNRTPNGLVLPKLECSLSYNVVVKNAVKLVSFLGMDDTCESAYMPINVRLPWGAPSPDVSTRAYSSLKWHTDIWAGEWAREVMVPTPLFGAFEKNGISFAEPPSDFYPTYVRDIPDYKDGEAIAGRSRKYDLTMSIGSVYLVDSFLLHKTLSGHPSFRGILSFPLRPRYILESDIYENAERADDFIPMSEWKEFGTKRLVCTDKILEPYIGGDLPTISYSDRYNLLKIL